VAVGLGFRFTRRNPVWPGSVSCSRSSNRTGGVTASGSRKRLTWLRVTPSATSEHKTGVARLVVNPRVLRRFLRPSLTEVPSLRRSYPASSVVRTSPPPQTARPGSRELPVDPDCDHRWGFPCCVWSPVSACRRHYPGRSDGTDSLAPFHRLRPSPDYRWVGTCIISFEACSAFTRVTTCRLAESPYATLFTGGFSGFVASTAAPIATGRSDPVPGRVFHPAEVQRLSRRTVIA
jgi:hypothetical protein